MISSDIYIRRSLWAPIAVPILASIAIVRGYCGTGQYLLMMDNPFEEVFNGVALLVALLLAASLIIGGVPYLFMLWDHRREIADNRGWLLTEMIRNFPMVMLPYYWKFWAVFGGVLLLSPNMRMYAIPCASIMIAGVIVVPFFGWLYFTVTMAFLRLFQRLGLIAKDFDVA